MPTRLEAIRMAAERLRSAKHSAPPAPAAVEGRWVRLEAVLGTHENRLDFGRIAPASRRTWGVLVPGVPAIGSEVLVRGGIGTLRERLSRHYVHAIVVPASARGDGCSIVRVDTKRPKDKPLVAQPKQEAPMPSGAFVSMGPVNPRVHGVRREVPPWRWTL